MVPTVLRGPGTGRSLPQRKCGREVVDPVHIRPLCLAQPARL